MSPSRWWTETVAALGDRLPLPLAALLLLLAAVLAALAWFHYPAWVPRRPPRWRLSRWRHGRRRTRPAPPAEPEPAGTADDPELPEVPAATLAALADRLAADGRYAEAARERFRGMVRELVDAGALEHRPGLTVTELAAAAPARPEVQAPFTEAGRLFSDLWYAERPARREHDDRMRVLATELTRNLGAGPATGTHTADGARTGDEGMVRR
ncbi:DUF4129 domain-containing protein [Plantactinospora sp. WMMB334]|uniref:DUF4129 domain-containing protein n=1 Tax=Plantactinospora sp. WMMB334 TaxID=3404119 RepID=UPI003B94A1BA